jgi:CheY-like chemotaxis protein
MSALAHIILADDDVLIRKALAQMVKAAATQFAIELTEVYNGEEALRIFSQRGARLIITDNQMPRMSGLDLTRALRARQQEVPVLLLSGDPATEAHARAAGATYFLNKPFKIAQLRNIIAEALSPER